MKRSDVCKHSNSCELHTHNTPFRANAINDFTRVPNSVHLLGPSRRPQLNVQGCDATLLGQSRRILGSQHGSVGGGLEDRYNSTSVDVQPLN